MAQFEDGVVGNFLLSDNSVSPFNWESAAGNNPSCPKASPPVECYRVFGSKGTVSGPYVTVWPYTPGQAEQLGLEEGWNIPISCELIEPPEGIPYQNQMGHFSKVIQGLEDPICSGKDGIATVKVYEAVIQALDRNDEMPVAI